MRGTKGGAWDGTEKLSRLRYIAETGSTMKQAAEEFGLSKQRIGQLASAHHVVFAGSKRPDPWLSHWRQLIGPMKAAVRADVEAMMAETPRGEQA